MPFATARTHRRTGAALAAAAVVATGGLALGSPAQAAIPASPAAAAATCADVDVVIARGTGEPGTYGWVVGDTVAQNMVKKLKGKKTVSTYAVAYPASTAAGSATAGNKDLVAHLVAQAAVCPKQVFVLAGYSQGANVVDMSFGIPTEGAVVSGPIGAVIPNAIAPKVKAAMLFGNPIRVIGKRVTGPYAARTSDICRPKDQVCDASEGANFGPHLLYFMDTDQATTFAVGKL